MLASGELSNCSMRDYSIFLSTKLKRLLPSYHIHLIISFSLSFSWNISLLPYSTVTDINMPCEQWFPTWHENQYVPAVSKVTVVPLVSPTSVIVSLQSLLFIDQTL